MNEQKRFDQECCDQAQQMNSDKSLITEARNVQLKAASYSYAYNWRWLGLPIIQLPPDVLAMQEIISRVKPDVIIETGIARGGSLLFYASMLALQDIEERKSFDILETKRRVIAVDIDIRPHNREAIEATPLSPMITMIEGSSIDDEVLVKVRKLLGNISDLKVVVVLDSNHTNEHVFNELILYSDFVSAGSYLIVNDTGIEYSTESLCKDKPWGPGNSPLTAVHEFLAANTQFAVDQEIGNKLLFTSNPSGFLKRM